MPSLAAALQVVYLLGIDLTQLNIAKVFDGLSLPGRFQSLRYAGCEVILDVAHNPAASAYLCRRLQASSVAGRSFALVAMMADKDRVESLRKLKPVIDSWYLAELKDIPRAASAEHLAQDLALIGCQLDGRGSVEECLKTLAKQVTPQDRIVVWGSFYTVAAALAVLQATH
jgi:dihydrofolate synthase/folylpolyglutamate synthase